MNNQPAGVWRLRHMTVPAGQDTAYGKAPDGLLTFTADLHFSVAVISSELPKVASGDRMSATDGENRAIARGSIGLYGTYRVDSHGAFVDQHVDGSTNPALTGQTLGEGTLTVAVTSDDELVMTSYSAQVPVGESTWRRVGAAGAPASGNQVAAAWRMRSATVQVGEQTLDPFGADPAGSLIFTDSLYFTDVLHRSDLAPLAGGDPLRGTEEENRRTVQGSLIVFGSYTVDADGVFRDEVVLGCSMPNWTGMRRDRRTLTETVHGDRMVEHLDDGDGVVVLIEFSRAPAA